MHIKHLLGSSYRFLRVFFIIVLVYASIFAVYVRFSPSQSGIRLKSDSEILAANSREMNRVFAESEAQNYPQHQLLKSLTSLNSCLFMGELCGTENKTASDSLFTHSIMGKATEILSLPFTSPPASGVYWAYSSLEKANLIPQTYAAQGIGFSRLQAFSSIWITFRNIAYTLMILAIVTVGFLIIFRIKINPQVAVTLENSLPRIFVTLLLITFSFPIAGFLIDLMYVTMLTVIATIGQADSSGSVINIQLEQYRFLNAKGGTLFDGMWNVGNVPWIFGPFQLWQVGDALLNISPTILSSTIKILGGGAILLGIVTKVDDLFLRPILQLLDNIQLEAATFGGSLGNLPSSIGHLVIKPVLFAAGMVFVFLWGGGLIIAFVLFITLIGIFARMYFLLFSSYVKIILYTIFAPVYLIPNVIPGNNTFTTWIRSLAGELSVYPTTVAVMMIGKLLYSIFSSIDETSVWRAPFTMGINPQAFGLIVTFILLYQIPDIVKFVRLKVNGNHQSPISFGIGALLGAGALGGASGGVGRGALQHTLSTAIGPFAGKKVKALWSRARGGGE